MTLILYYQMKHTVNLFEKKQHKIKNSFQYLVIPKPIITTIAETSETGWGIADWYNPSGVQWAEHERMHINVRELKRLPLKEFARTVIIEAIGMSGLW